MTINVRLVSQSVHTYEADDWKVDDMWLYIYRGEEAIAQVAVPHVVLVEGFDD